MEQTISILIRIKLSIQRAMLGHIIPEIRAICFSYDNQQKDITITMYMDDELTDFHKELLADITTEIVADFRQEDVRMIHDVAVNAKYNKQLNTLNGLVYRRYEK